MTLDAGPATVGPGSGPALDGVRLLARLDQLAGIGAESGVGARSVDGGSQGGVTRLAWGPDDRKAVELVAAWAVEAGATVRVDPIGTLVIDLPGRDPTLAPLAMGSHLDTVVAAGPLDGAYGVVAGIEVLAAVAAAGPGLRHSLRVAAFVNEEGVVAPPFTGSRAVAGEDLGGELEATGPDGRTLRQRVADAGGDMERSATAAWGPLAGYLEIHIEQGPVLDATGARAAVVTAVTGQQRARIEVTGRANHAGTTPMAMRHDALVAAAHGVLAVEALAVSGQVEVATVGRLGVSPDVPNVVPGSAVFTVDVRSVDDSCAVGAIVSLRQQLHDIAADTGTTIALFPTTRSSAVATDPAWRAILHRASAARGVVAIELPSGAGHDAQHLARLGPMGMLFVPSIAGLSHHPDERTAGADLVLGAQVALDAIVAADAAFDA